MIINGLKLSKVDQELYHELIRLGYPEDRIQVGYRVCSSYRSDITILAPGVSELPIAVFEVEDYPNQLRPENVMEFAVSTKETFACDFYLYFYKNDQSCVHRFNGSTFEIAEIPTYKELLKNIRKKYNYISDIAMENFSVFEYSKMNFCNGVNVFIGENGTGKTQILKMLYTICMALNKQHENFALSMLDIVDVFKIEEEEELVSRNAKKRQQDLKINITFKGLPSISFCIGHDGGITMKNPPIKNMYSFSYVYLPSHEVFSIYKHYFSFYNAYRRKWLYDATYTDLISYLGLPPTESFSESVDDICSLIGSTLGGYFYLDEKNDTFMFKRLNEEIPFPVDLTAEGWRKLGEILVLLKNGVLTQGSILFWDEPEANLNPALIKVIAHVIVQLGAIGVQVFLTTHSLFLLRELDILAKSKSKIDGIRYFNFPQPGTVETGSSPEDLGDILTLNESIAQSERFMQMED